MDEPNMCFSEIILLGSKCVFKVDHFLSIQLPERQTDYVQIFRDYYQNQVVLVRRFVDFFTREGFLFRRT